jgi:fructose-1,6-bisphosphatase/inositol monophosphatase family enzyme
MTRVRQPHELLQRIRAVHEAIRDEVLAVCNASSTEELSRVVGDDAGDTLFAIDRVSESVLLDRFSAVAADWPCLLVAEGLGHDGRQILPRGARPEDVEIAVLVDPIDGTRGLMYQKRPAWILTGVAPASPSPTLADVELAVQTEIPLVKQHLSDTLFAIAGEGAKGERYDRLTGERRVLSFAPSRSTTLLQGYGGIARFFPGARAELAAVDDTVIERLLGPVQKGRALCFEDQYISTGGQLSELVMGHDRWIADVRPLVDPLLRKRGQALGICCHPYDLATELVAREAGAVITDVMGNPLRAPLDVFTEVAWVGYANEELCRQVGPVLRAVLREHGLLEGG